MRMKSLALLLALALVFISLAGCGDVISFKNPAVKRREVISAFLDKDVTGEVGKTYKTKWFEFTIQSIEKVKSYADYQAKEGHQLYKVPIVVKSAWDESIPMGTFDFYLDAPDFEEYIWAIPPLDDTMMPEKYDLKPGETVQYVMLFEAPTGIKELMLLYTESFEGGRDGATFAIPIK